MNKRTFFRTLVGLIAAPAVIERIKLPVKAEENGIYTVTAIGSQGSPWEMMRNIREAANEDYADGEDGDMYWNLTTLIMRFHTGDGWLNYSRTEDVPPRQINATYECIPVSHLSKQENPWELHSL